MRIRIRHETHYRLAAPARRSVQILRLTPRPDRGQRVVHWTVGGPPALVAWTDALGNRLHLASEADEHQEVLIRAEGEVETANTWGVLPPEEGLPPLMFLRETALTRATEAVRAFALPFAGLRRDGDVAMLHALMLAIAGRVDYRPGQTGTASTADEALAAGAGVCQDHAHLFIACARTVGLPCRYVSGYLAGNHGEAASHAWAEAFVEGLGWVSFDAANRQSATEAYVRLAVGFDYAGACPVTGSRHGGTDETLDVRLQVGQVQS